jgi:hypothetical protein
LYEIENFLNPTRPTGGNLEFAVLYFTTHNAALKAIRQLNNLTIVTQLEGKTLRARYSIKLIISFILVMSSLNIYYHEVAGEDFNPFSGHSKPTTADR